jgi:FkbM family methyltransferase
MPKIQRKRSLFDFLKDFFFIKKNNKLLIDILIRQKNNIKFYKNLAVPAFDYISSCIIIDGMYEKRELEALSLKLKNKFKKKILLDIGAHIGNHSIFLSPYFNKVLSFEPNKFTYKFLEFNREYRDNVFTFNFGAANLNKRMMMSHNTNNLGSNKVIDKKVSSFLINNMYQQKNKKYSLANFKKFDDIKFLKNKNIGAIKLDLENYETEALLGMRNLIKKNKPIIIFENSFSNNDYKIFNFLRDAGYNYLYLLKKPNWFVSEKYPKFIRNTLKLIEIIIFKAPEYKFRFQISNNLSERYFGAHFSVMSFYKL